MTGKVGDERRLGRGSDEGIKVATYLFISFPEERLGVEEHISHNYKEHSSVHSMPGAREGKGTPQTFGRLGPIHIPNPVRPLGRWLSMFSFPRRYLQQQRRTRGHRRREQGNERFSLPLPLPLPLPLLRYLRFSKLAKVDRPVRRRPCTRADIRISDPGTHTDGCRSPFPSVIELLYRPAFMDTLCLDLELPLQSRVGIQVINGIQLGPVAPDPTGCARAARAFGLHSDGRERDGDLGVREGRHCAWSVGGD